MPVEEDAAAEVEILPGATTTVPASATPGPLLECRGRSSEHEPDDSGTGWMAEKARMMSPLLAKRLRGVETQPAMTGGAKRAKAMDAEMG